MNFYQRRLGVLSKKHFKLVQRLNQLRSKIIGLVSDKVQWSDFFVPKDKNVFDKEVIDKIMEFHRCSYKHAVQIILIEGYENVRKNIGLKK